MAKFVIKDGSFLNRETSEVNSSISGKFAGVRTVTSENGVAFIHIDLASEAEGPDGQPSVDTLCVRKYGDASLKILRCLYGIVDIILGKTVTFSLEEREGRSSLINVTADGETLTPMGVVEPYASEKKMLTDKMTACLMRAGNYRKDILVFSVNDGIAPAPQDGQSLAEAVAAHVLSARMAGCADNLTVKKYGFSNEHAANGYMLALSDLGRSSAFTVFTDLESIGMVWDAYTSEIPEAASCDGDVETEC